MPSDFNATQTERIHKISRGLSRAVESLDQLPCIHPADRNDSCVDAGLDTDEMCDVCRTYSHARAALRASTDLVLSVS